MAGSSSSPYRWRPSDTYRQWHVCDNCLIPLADALQDRVEKWQRPPRDEEDDERPDYAEIRKRRFHDVFFRPLDSDLQQHDFQRGMIWLSIHAPSVATAVQEKIGQLRAALTPPDYGSLDTDAAVVYLADVSFFLHQVAEGVRPLAGSTAADVENPPEAKPKPPTHQPGKLETSESDTSVGFHVFLSHNSTNKPSARELKRLLAERGLNVWLDEDELRPGVSWQKTLEEAIKTSQSVAVLVGEDGLGPWQDEEMQAALRHAVNDKRPVIPVLLPGAPGEPELPMFLENRTWVDLRAGFVEEGLHKLVWGITGQKPV